MAEDSWQGSYSYPTGYQLGGRAAPARPEPLPWGQGAALGLALALTVVVVSFVVARVALAAAPASTPVRFDIAEVVAQAVTGHFGVREQVVALYALRELRADYRPVASRKGRAVFTLAAGLRAFDLRSPIAIAAAPGSLIRLDVQLFALDPHHGDPDLLESDPGQAVASGQAALIGCITHTLSLAELDTIQRRGGSYQYDRMLPGVCTPGAALPVAESPYRVTYRVSVGRPGQR
jgi:hypothetical protein